MRIITEADIRAVIGAPEALASAERAFRALAEGALELPPPIGLAIPEFEGEVHVKSAFLKGSPIFAVKVASGFYQNPSRGLPSGSGLILVFDASTGFPVALLDDHGYLTELRTAAAGALAARLLAAPQVTTVGVLGSGVQARFQLRALAGVRRWERARAWSPNPDRLRTYCREMERDLQSPFTAAAGPEEVVRDADLLLTATPSREPILEAHWLAPHATVIAIGSDGPEKRELPTAALLRADKIVVDRLSQCLELGEVHHAVHEGALNATAIHAELGEVLTGSRPGREGDELIICDLTGVGAQDAAIAELVWGKLLREG